MILNLIGILMLKGHKMKPLWPVFRKFDPMKRVLHPVLSLFLLMAILVNTAGITVYNHFCLEEGESTLSFSKDENCCADKHPAKKNIAKHACCEKKNAANSISEIKKPGCCSQDEFSAQWKITESSFHKFVDFSSPSKISQSNKFEDSFILPSFISSFFISSSPPYVLSDQDILVKNSVFRI